MNRTSTTHHDTHNFRSALGRILAVALTAVVFGFSSPAPADAQPTRETLQNATLEVGMLARRLEQTPAHGREALSAKLSARMGQRRHLLAQMVEEAPDQALRFALPGDLVDRLPPQAKLHAERFTQLDGTLEITYEDGEDYTRLHHVINADGAKFSLHFSGAPTRFATGDRVRARGLLVPGSRANGVGIMDGVMAVDAGGEEVILMAADGESIATSSSTPTPWDTFGEQRTLLVLVNYQDRTAEPNSLAEVQDLVFGQVSDFYLESSSDRTWLAGDAMGWFTLPFASEVTSCDPAAIAEMADALAVNAGADLSTYSRFIYYMYPHPNCGWGGQGTVGGSPSRTWINGRFDVRTVSHELGHNLGLLHSHSNRCSDGPLGSDCTFYEYGDFFDSMGSPNPGHFNGFQKERLGWLDGDIGLSAVESTGSGSYELSPYETAGVHPGVLKIPAGVDPISGNRIVYYAEYRLPVGWDDFIPVMGRPGDAQGGVVIRRVVEGDAGSSTLLYMQADLYSATLPVGQSFTDTEGGVTLTVDWADATSAGVTLDMGGSAPVCNRTAPGLSLSPATGPWVPAGTQVNFLLTVTNHDSDGCAAGEFPIADTAPAGWTVWVEDASLPLAPGGSATTVAWVTSPGTAADGFYDIDLTASNGAAPALSATATATYAVENPTEPPPPPEPPVNSAPTPSDDTATTQAKTPVTMNILANDTDPDGDALTLVSVELSANGTSVWGSDGTLTFTPSAKLKDSTSFTYEVQDTAGNRATATVTISIQSKDTDDGTAPPSKGGGKGKIK